MTELIKKLEGHTSWVTCLVFSPDRAILASGSDDGTIRLWSFPEGEHVMTLEHGHEVKSLAVTPDGRRLASGGIGRYSNLFMPYSRHEVVHEVPPSVHLWNLSGGKLKTRRKQKWDVFDIAITPDGRTLVTAGGSFDRGQLSLWRLPRVRHIKTFERHSECITCLAITPDGNMLVSGCGERTTVSRDYAVQISELPTGKHLRALVGHHSSVTCLAITPDGTILASGSEDKTIRLWSLPEGEHMRTLEAQTWITCLAITPDGGILVSGECDGKIRLWSVSDGECIETWETGHSAIECFAMDPKGEMLASASVGNAIHLWALP